jgi:hypothetical protein
VWGIHILAQAEECGQDLRLHRDGAIHADWTWTSWKNSTGEEDLVVVVEVLEHEA